MSPLWPPCSSPANCLHTAATPCSPTDTSLVSCAREPPPSEIRSRLTKHLPSHPPDASLSPTFQSLLLPLTGLNTSSKADASKTREDRLIDHAKAMVKPEAFVGRHPVVRTH